MAKGTLEVGGTAEGGKMASLEVEQSATGGVAGALIIDNNDTDKQAIVVEAANIDAVLEVIAKGTTSLTSTSGSTTNQQYSIDEIIWDQISDL